MKNQSRRSTAGMKHRERTKLDQRLAKQSLTPKNVEELVRSTIRDGTIGGETDKQALESGHLAESRHPMFWREDDF